MVLQGQIASKRAKPKRDSRSKASVGYTAKITKACALLGDTKTLLSHWDSTATPAENIDRIQRQNVFGKASRSRVVDIMTIFRQRYLTDDAVTTSLVSLLRGKFSSASLDRILYFHSACADQLLHDAVTRILVPMYLGGQSEINVAEFKVAVEKLLAAANVRPWSDITTLRVVQCLLATLRDFGVLEGVTRKKILPAFLPVDAFAYIMFYLKQRQPSGSKLLELSHWKLFFLSKEGVERFLFEAHQRELLEYHVAGSVTRLTFPANTLEEYANVLAQR